MKYEVDQDVERAGRYTHHIEAVDARDALHKARDAAVGPVGRFVAVRPATPRGERRFL